MLLYSVAHVDASSRSLAVVFRTRRGSCIIVVRSSTTVAGNTLTMAVLLRLLLTVGLILSVMARLMPGSTDQY